MKDRQWKWCAHYVHSNCDNCDQKRTFNSFSEASGFNKRARRFLRGNRRSEHLHVYRCNGCQQWHIGHEPARPNRYKEDYRD